MGNLSSWNTAIFEAKYTKHKKDTIDEAIERMITSIWQIRPEKDHILTTNSMRNALLDRLFVPGGRVWATVGRDRQQLMNCFVIPIGDSRAEIVKALGETFDIQAYGGGVGYNFSGLRPYGETIKSTGGVAQGGVSFIGVFDALSGVINGVNDRKAANMGIVNDNYPDVLEFVNKKASDPGKNWKNFNVSVGLQSQDFLDNVRYGEGKHWLYYGSRGIREIDSMELWNAMMQAQWKCGDPGIVNFRKIREMQNTHYLPEDFIIATNPCGEIPLPAYGVCDLGSINLSECIRKGEMDYSLLEFTVRAGVEFLDCVLDANYYPLLQISDQAQKVRRIGIGVLGLAHALMKCGIEYGTPKALSVIDEWWRVIATIAYETSIALSAILGPFPGFDKKILDSGYMRFVLDNADINSNIVKHGIRNSHLLTQAPTGTISMLVGASSGIEPLFATEMVRNDRLGKRTIVDRVAEKYKDHVVTAHELNWEQHLDVQSMVQKWVDQSVSKTINLPADATVDDIDRICRRAIDDPWIKGVTIFRDKSLPEQVLNHPEKKQTSPFVAGGTVKAGKLKAEVSYLTYSESDPGTKPKFYREKRMASMTYYCKTPQGSAYVTIARNQYNSIQQVFVKCDKVGTDNHAWANALGRTLSIALQTGSSPEKLAKTLIDCQSSSIVWDDLGFAAQPLMVRSLPDAVGKILMHEIKVDDINVYDVMGGADGCLVCGGATRPEGNCEVCTVCGYSPCS